MRRVLPLLALLAGAPALGGEPILVPDFTPATTSEFGLAYMLQERVSESLQSMGHVVLTSEVVEPVVGDATANCADVPACPFEALQQLPTRIAVVVRVLRRDDGLYGEASLYHRDDPTPVETRLVEIEQGNEEVFGEEVAHAIDDVLSLLGPSHAQDLIAAVKLIEASEEEPAPVTEPEPPSQPEPEPVPRVVEPGEPLRPEVDRSTAPLARLLEGTDVMPRHVAGSERAFRESGEDPRDWVYRQTPHAGRLAVEVRGGIGLGDTDRRADVRKDLDDRSDWFQEGPLPGERVRGSLYVGYAPVTFFDVGLLVGLQYGVKQLTYGWYGGDEEPFQSEVEEVQAVQFYLQPRARFYLASLGILKPYLFVAPELRVFDAYKIDSPSSFTYAAPEAGAVPGIGGGGGLMLDPGPIVGFFAEGSYTRYFGVLSRASQMAGSTRPPDAPPAPEASQGVVGIVGGVQFRL